jgi:hypothetical protein
MKKLNCWEVKQCGCCEGGTHVDEKGPCPASTMVSLSGVNGGKNGGRSCWAIDWTHCKTKEGGRFSDKYSTCLACSFYMQVWLEEGLDFRGVRAIRRVIEGRQAA